MLYNLIETAKVNTFEPHACLRFIFEKLPAAANIEEYETIVDPSFQTAV